MRNNSRKLTTPQSANSYVKSICDIMRRSGRAGALQYVPELTWMLFLRILDEREEKETEQAKAVGAEFVPTLEHFEGFFKLLPERAASDRSWKVPIEEIEARNYDIKAVNPNRKSVEDTRTPEELIAIIEEQQAEIAKAIAQLKEKRI